MNMFDNMNNIEFISRLANILAKKISPSNTVNSVNKLFKGYLNIDFIDFIIWDSNNLLLKDFVCDWKIFDDENQEKEINYIYSNLSLSSGNLFYFNDEEFNCEIKQEQLIQMKEVIVDENIVIYPLISNSEVFGLMRLIIKKKDILSKDFFEILNVSSKLLSGAIINYLLNEQMEVSLNFYKAMKDIAKIIESQYELSYIIPLIGEMIDRFISSHLIYIFITEIFDLFFS